MVAIPRLTARDDSFLLSSPGAVVAGRPSAQPPSPSRRPPTASRLAWVTCCVRQPS